MDEVSSQASQIRDQNAKGESGKKILTPTRFELVPPKRPGMYGKVTLPWRLRPLGQSAYWLVDREVGKISQKHWQILF